MKALVGACNLEKALVGAFSVIANTDSETDGSSAALIATVSWGNISGAISFLCEGLELDHISAGADLNTEGEDKVDYSPATPPTLSL